MSHHHHSYNVVVVTIAGILGVLAIITEYFRKRKANLFVAKIAFRRISGREFRRMLGKHKYACLTSRIASPATGDYFQGTYEGVISCIFTIATGGKYTTTRRLAVLLKGDFSHLPHFIVKSKSFSGEVGDMLGLRKHDPLYPMRLIDKYDVISDDSTATASILTSQFVDYSLTEEGIGVESFGGDLLIYTILDVVPENYEVAIRQAYRLAGLLGIKHDTTGGKSNQDAPDQKAVR